MQARNVRTAASLAHCRRVSLRERVPAVVQPFSAGGLYSLSPCGRQAPKGGPPTYPRAISTASATSNTGR